MDTASRPFSGLLRSAAGFVPRIRLAGAARPARLPGCALTDPALTAPHWLRLHDEAPEPAPFDLASFGPMPVRLAGPGLIWHGERLLDDNSIMPGYVGHEIARDDHALLKRLAGLPVRREGRPALVFHGWGVQVYGHFLIEMLPKLLLASRFASLFDGLLPVLDRTMPGWFITILREHLGIDPDRAIWIDPNAEQLALDHAVVLPLLARSQGYHPASGPMFDEFAARVGIRPSGPIPRLFVARGNFRNPAAPQRVLDNEAELAQIAVREFGFAILRPETLPFAYQVGLFAQAEAIVGQIGSGMHNALFAPKGCTIGVIRFHALDQAAIAALRGQRIAYLTEGIAEPAPGRFMADPERFRRFLEKLLQP